MGVTIHAAAGLPELHAATSRCRPSVFAIAGGELIVHVMEASHVQSLDRCDHEPHHTSAADCSYYRRCGACPHTESAHAVRATAGRPRYCHRCPGCAGFVLAAEDR